VIFEPRLNTARDTRSVQFITEATRPHLSV
jgi:hypothetical protein